MLEKIFSIKSFNKTHNLVRFLGIKFKFPKSSVKKNLKRQNYYVYAKKNLDITTIPPAEGQVRDIQLANLALLKEMDYVCKQNGLTYWLDFGTLLGAVRHRGFIPWDDDIDLGMPRVDYNKLIQAFSQTSKNPDIFVDYCQCTNKPCQLILKIQHKKCSKLFVDIFPYDQFSENLSVNEQLMESKKLKNIRIQIQKKYNKNLLNEEIKTILEKQRYVVEKQSQSKLLFWGLDYSHHWKNWFTDSDTIYPLKEIEFEKNMFPCFNYVEKYLQKVYGNYMKYPKKFGYGHNMFTNLTEEEKAVIMELRKAEVVL